ncbi:MAG: hypothetical protein ACM3VW_08225, partial [Bacteroidota bacterium]
WTQRALRTDRWKLTWYPLIERYQLFDLQQDPQEMWDLLVPWRSRRRRYEAEGKQNWSKEKWSPPDNRFEPSDYALRTILVTLRTLLMEQMERTGDPLLAKNRRPDPLGALH